MIGENRFTLTEIALELRKLLKHRIAENEAHTPNETGQKGKDRNAGTRNLKAKQIEELLNTL